MIYRGWRGGIKVRKDCLATVKNPMYSLWRGVTHILACQSRSLVLLVLLGVLQEWMVLLLLLLSCCCNCCCKCYCCCRCCLSCCCRWCCWSRRTLWILRHGVWWGHWCLRHRQTRRCRFENALLSVPGREIWDALRDRDSPIQVEPIFLTTWIPWIEEEKVYAVLGRVSTCSSASRHPHLHPHP